MPISTENLRKFSEEHGNLWEFPKTLETLQTRFWELKRFKKVLENVWQSLEVFGKIRRRSKMVLKCTENLRKYSEVFGNSRKTSETAQVFFQMILCFFKIIGKSSEPLEVLGNLRKFSKNFGNGSKLIFRCFYDFLKFSENLRKLSEVFGNLRKISGCDRKCS